MVPLNSNQEGKAVIRVLFERGSGDIGSSLFQMRTDATVEDLIKKVHHKWSLQLVGADREQIEELESQVETLIALKDVLKVATQGEKKSADKAARKQSAINVEKLAGTRKRSENHLSVSIDLSLFLSLDTSVFKLNQFRIFLVFLLHHPLRLPHPPHPHPPPLPLPQVIHADHQATRLKEEAGGANATFHQ